MSARYERSRLLAQKKVDEESEKSNVGIARSSEVDHCRAARQVAASQQQSQEDETYDGQKIIEGEQSEEREMRQTLRRSTRRKTGSFDPKSDGLWGLTGRMTNGLHGRSTAILHTDGRH